jgi:hypothetical protein
MSYLTQNDIANNMVMRDRIAQAVATENPSSPNPDQWAFDNRRHWAAAPGWDAAWESSLVAHPEEDYNPGTDEGVITDGMILSQIQSMNPA